MSHRPVEVMSAAVQQNIAKKQHGRKTSAENKNDKKGKI